MHFAHIGQDILYTVSSHCCKGVYLAGNPAINRVIQGINHVRDNLNIRLIVLQNPINQIMVFDFYF